MMKFEKGENSFDEADCGNLKHSIIRPSSLAESDIFCQAVGSFKQSAMFKSEIETGDGRPSIQTSGFFTGEDELTLSSHSLKFDADGSPLTPKIYKSSKRKKTMRTADNKSVLESSCCNPNQQKCSIF